MAPPRIETDYSILPNTQEYADFINKLAAYHEKRGTNFDPTPRVGMKNIDLLKLYDVVISKGGYDKVSDEKLAWRKIGEEFNLGQANLPALAFALKTTFYKYLAAYEIFTIHGKEPPPREILEDQTAKGSGLLSRTLENYRPSARRETGALGNENSEASGDDGTPSRDRHGSEEAPGSGGRVTRGLRHAPPQRVLFQPDTHSTRQNKNTAITSHPPNTHQHQTPQPQYRGASTSYNPSSSMENMSPAVANYEPRVQMPLTLRTVLTPGNNAVEWARRQKVAREHANNTSGRPPPAKVVFPGTNFDGPNIYVRCLCAIKSGIPEEQAYALHHLVKISMERGDKFKFETFPGLAEALIEKALSVCNLFYDVEWDIRYVDDGPVSRSNIIDGLNGTKDIIPKVEVLSKLNVDDNIQSAEFSDALVHANEAALILRNMAMLDENSEYVSELYPLRDFLSIALNLPNVECVVELKHYALDIAEQVTKWWHFDETDPLYQNLLRLLQSQDRGAILTSLRAINRASMNLEENNLLKGIPVSIIQNIVDWTILNDEELVHACLDFLYQYTAVVSNVDLMLSGVQVEPLVNQLTRLLMYNVKVTERDMALGPDQVTKPPPRIAQLPQDLYNKIMHLDEPERSKQWLRCLFEEDVDESITQIALWQGYQQQFAQAQMDGGRTLLPAADFIKNVSTTFHDKAVAQVQQGPNPKFIIRGIRYRSKPVDFNMDEYSRCLWQNPYGPEHHPGGEFHMSSEDMYKHVLKDHLGQTQRSDGKYENVQAQYSCQWDRCHRFKVTPTNSLADIARHVKIHLKPVPSASKAAETSAPPAKKRKPSYRTLAPRQSFSSYQTLTEDPASQHPKPAGIPFSAVLVLRNLARNISKTETGEAAMKVEGAVSMVDKLFKPVEHRLYDVFAHNKALAEYMTDLLSSIRD